jgi:hypothetical protein
VPALEDERHQDINEGDSNVNPPFRATVPERERSSSPELDPEDATLTVRFVSSSRKELKEQISSLTGQLEGHKMHSKTQQAAMDSWKAQFRALFTLLKCAPNEVQDKVRSNFVRDHLYKIIDAY